MIVENRTPYPDAEVRRIVVLAMKASPGATPAKIKVLYRTLPSDTRLGFTPFDRRQPISIWIEPANRYPQHGARSWRDELLTSTLHEAHHYRHQGCHGQVCESSAEKYAQSWRRKLRRA